MAAKKVVLISIYNTFEYGIILRTANNVMATTFYAKPNNLFNTA
jgi:hypothetical protein